MRRKINSVDDLSTDFSKVFQILRISFGTSGIKKSEELSSNGHFIPSVFSCSVDGTIISLEDKMLSRRDLRMKRQP